MRSANRRRLLKAALAGAGSAWWAPGAVFAQAPGRGLSRAGSSGAAIAQASPSSLLRAKKQALVIGNSQYKQSPLRNPANDANGIAEALKRVGFDVSMGVELSQAQMRDAIRAYVESLEQSKAVGLFYFAGHGAQLAWRNYLIPVDADIVNIEELRERAVDVNNLIGGLKRAGNPMNLVILDACRDNPFGSIARVDQKGLSQLDAPVGTLLAYATAPGNTAIDGEGEHGLYTEHLLREIGVAEAKVEDVFKRVRLGVRRQSRGRQIPWESTSLEQDFWFVPPEALRRQAEAEIEAGFKKELALWEAIRGVDEPAPLEDYLRRYPSGRFTELAQLQLDRVLARLGETKIEIVSAPKNPYSKGTLSANTAYKVGDRYFYRRIDLLTQLELKPQRFRVTEITDSEIIYNDGRYVTDLLGNSLRFRKGAVWSPNQTVPTEFAVGKRWNTRFQVVTAKGREGVLDLELRIVDREEITVPAGRFNAFRVEAHGWRTTVEGPGVSVDWKTWYAPDRVRRPIAAEVFNTNDRGKIVASNRSELVHFRQS